jgi:DNA-directed RNA polymerase specialized sigma24 family protein
LEELSELYDEKKAKLMQDIIAVERAITSLPPDLQMLMRYRYIMGLKWEQINERMYISATQSKRMHHAALKKLGAE